MENPSQPTPRPMREPLHEVDWLAIAPWTMLFRVPGATFGWPFVLGALGLLVLGTPWIGLSSDVSNPIEAAWGYLSRVPTSLIEPLWLPDGANGGAMAFFAVFRWIGWLILGGVISNLVGRKLTGTPRISLFRAVRETLFQIPRLLLALAMFAVIGGILIGGLLVFGYVLTVPGLASLAAPLVGLAALIGGIPLVLLFAVGVLGSPLLVAAMSIDKADAFDAVSRVVAYISQRIGRLTGYLLVAIVLGWGVGVLIELVVNATVWVTSRLVILPPDARSEPLMSLSVRAFATAIRGFYPAYIFSAGSAIYLLLRRDVDGQPIEEMQT